MAAVVALCWAGTAGAELSVFYPLDEAEIAEYEAAATEFLRDFVPEDIRVSVRYGVELHIGSGDGEDAKIVEGCIAKSFLILEPRRGYETVLYRDGDRWVVHDHEKWFLDAEGPGEWWPVVFPACLDFVLAERIADHVRPLLYAGEAIQGIETADEDGSVPCAFPVEVHTDFCRDGERCDRWIEVVWDAGQLVATQARERNSGWSHDNCRDEETE